MKRIVVTLGFLLAAMPAVAAQVQVSMVDFAFNPDSVNISPGDTVQWTNNGYYAHTSTSGVNGVPDGRWNSGDVSPGGSYSRAFDSSGTFHYFCMHHYPSGMVGVIYVNSTGVGDSRYSAVSGPVIRSFPNPFRSTTTLYMPLSTGSPVHSTILRIYDVSGLLVRTLRVSASSVLWNGRDQSGRNLPAGVYHCVSRAGTVQLMKLN